MANGEMKEEARQRVIEEITRAFDGVSREDGVTLHEAIALDDYATDDEQAAARALDTETRWQDVPNLDIENGCFALAFFDAKGFRYYIPAYMIWTLRYYDTSSSASSDFTLYALSPDSEYNLSRFQLLTPLESAAVCAFLHYMAANDEGNENDARKALNGYWGRFCAG